MSVVRKTRFLVLLVLPLIVLTTTCTKREAFGFTGPCADMTGSDAKNAPIVCVDDTESKLRANPPTITAWDKISRESNAPVTVQWRTRSGKGNIRIEPKSKPDNHCPLTKAGNGAGVYLMQTIPGQTTDKCEYTIFVDSLPPLDPTIIITPCC